MTDSRSCTKSQVLNKLRVEISRLTSLGFESLICFGVNTADAWTTEIYSRNKINDQASEDNRQSSELPQDLLLVQPLN